MDQPLSAAEANRSFCQILRDVRGGRTDVVTALGKPVVRSGSVGETDAASSAARPALLARLDAQPTRDAGRWSRDELYER